MKRAFRWLVVGLAVVLSLGAVPAGQAQELPSRELPSDQETLDLMRDQWGRTTFAPTGVGDWERVSHWTRVRQHEFVAGTDEFSGEPVQLPRLIPRTMELFERSRPGGVEFGVIEDVIQDDGSVLHNYFPTFRGDLDSFVFYNNVAPDKGGEYEETCRPLSQDGQDYLLCRIITPDNRIYYQVNVPTGTEPTTLPHIRRVMALFRDQWGRADFTETGVGGWTLVRAWNRARVFFFPPGTTELNGTGTAAAGIPLRFEQYSRTLPDGKVEFGIFHIAPSVPATTFLPPFRGDLEEFTFYVVNTADENPGAPLGEFEETCRILHADEGEFLVCRTITPDGAINYQTAVPT
jgi:hypothetical protein